MSKTRVNLDTTPRVIYTSAKDRGAKQQVSGKCGGAIGINKKFSYR